MLRQLIHILMCCSLVDIIIAGIVCNAGGNNRSCIDCLCAARLSVNGMPERILFPNMYIGFDSLIYVWYCSTHNIKSCQNQLLTPSGSEKVARQFHDIYNVYFGWPNLLEQWKREQNHTNQGEVPLTNLSLSSVYPDKNCAPSARSCSLLLHNTINVLLEEPSYKIILFE